MLSSLSGSLTRLEAHEAYLPPTLAALTWLRHLHVKAESEGINTANAKIVRAALPQLTQLTCLVRDAGWAVGPVGHRQQQQQQWRQQRQRGSKPPALGVLHAYRKCMPCAVGTSQACSQLDAAPLCLHDLRRCWA